MLCMQSLHNPGAIIWRQTSEVFTTVLMGLFMTTNKILNRRSFLQIASASAVGLAIAAPALHAATAAAPKAPAAPATLPKLELTNPTAKALGYVEDSTKVDKVKYPKHTPAQICGNCALIQGDPKNVRNPCVLFPGRSVASKGWCASYAKKA